ncbi:MAG: HIT domain-containing protein [Candidatus Omnitrophica bacterium]|nr:HIT domain-containing protein [Candidatus Omnitrophota bacterium]
MDRLWAPWRMEYILGEKSQECVFCQILRERNDEDNLVLRRSRHCFAMLNKFPYNNGHLLIVANRHIANLTDLSPEEIQDMMKLAQEMIKIENETMNPDGFNTGINIGQSAGAGIIHHIHMHIVPRWSGDTNFMPVTGGTKIIPQSLEELYSQFKKLL